jgi:two-component system, chemotaxis family, CheB/CheR fusion protein
VSASELATNGPAGPARRTNSESDGQAPQVVESATIYGLSEDLLQALPVAIYTTDADGLVTSYNEAAARLWGRHPELGKEEYCGSYKLFWPDGTPLPLDQCPMAMTLRQKRAIRGLEAVCERPDGSRIALIPYPTPIFDRSGNLVGAVNMVVDISERKRTEDALAKHRDEQAALYQLTDSLYRAETLDQAHEAALDAIGRALGCERASVLLFDDAGVMRFAAWRGLSDSYRQAVEGHSPWTPDAKGPEPICIDDVGASDLPDALKAIVSAEGIEALAFVPVTANGVLVGKFMTYYSAPHAFSKGEVDLAVTIARQLGFSIERFRAEEFRRRAQARQELLAREIQHRTKNLFAVVLAVVARSFVGKNTVKDAEDAVVSRLRSLGDTHVMLIDKQWQGADLMDIVCAEMSPFAGRVQIEGTSLILSATAAQNFALALHELATNAAKYGALSNTTGRVHIFWSEQKSNGPSSFVFRWRELGGPAVSAPAQKGFGSAVLEQVMAQYFEGSPHVEFLASGVAYELNGTLETLVAEDREASSRAQ